MPAASAAPAPPQSLKQRVLICLTKLSDRDTHAQAATELDSIARCLSPESFPVFLTCIQSTDAADKSPVRKQCVVLIATLCVAHGNSLSPYIAKMLTAVTRRLRDPDSAVRSACVNTAATLAAKVTRPSFDSFVKAFTDALYTEQDMNAQMGAALCLASAIDAAPNPEPTKLARLMPRFEKLLKSGGFKGKAGVLTLIGSVVNAGGAGSVGILKNLVPTLMGFLSSEDWSARKAAAEVLLKLAVVERNILAEYKTGCLKIFEARRFDKVKAVRDIMNQMLEAWKQVPDIADEVSPPSHSVSSSKENTDDGGRYTRGTRNLSSAGKMTSIVRKGQLHPLRSNPENSSAATSRKRIPLKNSDRNTNPSAISKVGPRRLSDLKIGIAVSNSSLSKDIDDEDDDAHFQEIDENMPQGNNRKISQGSKLEVRRALFNKKSGSRIAPYNNESSESNHTYDLHKSHKDCEDLSSIKGQLEQIEKQQSDLLDLLQKFIGSSQNGLRSLETRVHGLELALDEISYDLAVTTGRMSNPDSATTCCMMPSDILSSRFWRKQDNKRQITSRLSTSTRTSSVTAARFRAGVNDTELGALENHIHRFRGVVVNPLAKHHGDSWSITLANERDPRLVRGQGELLGKVDSAWIRVGSYCCCLRNDANN